MHINIAICDDDINSLSVIKNYIEHYGMLTDTDFIISEYTDPILFVGAYQNNPDIDILFLDVEMPNMDGLTLAKKIREYNKNHTEIVFVSSYPEYMQESFGVHPYHYLTKPISETYFDKLLTDLINDINNLTLSKLTISTNERDIIVNINDIIYIQVLKGHKNILEYVLTDNTYIGKGNLTELAKQLADYNFYTIYRGIIANISHIKYFTKTEIIFTNELKLPLSRSYAKLLKNKFANSVLNLKL